MSQPDTLAAGPAAAPRTPTLDIAVRHWPLLVAGYFLLQAASRLLVAGTLNLDEAEQIILARELRLGYGPQPPLYTWLQWLVFQVTGPSIAGLTLLKNLLLACTYWFTFRAAANVLGSRAGAVAAALSLLFIPQVVWESQRDLSHSVLVTTSAAACLYAFSELLRSGARRWFVILGLGVGAGLLSKYSFVLYAAAMLAAALTLAAARRQLLRPALAVTLGLAALIALPHYLWALDHVDQATGSILGKLDTRSGWSVPMQLAAGWGALLWALFQFLSPLWLIYGVLFWRRGSPDDQPLGPDPLWRALLHRYVGAFAVGITVLILVTGATFFKDRWMLPFAFLAPLYLLAVVAPRVSRRRLELLARTASVFAMAVLIAIPLRVPVAGWLDKPMRLNAPVAEVADVLERRGWSGGVLITDENYLAGTFQLNLAGTVVVDASRGLRPTRQRLAGRCGVTLVWEEAPDAGPPPALRQRYREIIGSPWPGATAETLQLSYRFSTTPFRLGLARIREACTGGAGREAP